MSSALFSVIIIIVTIIIIISVQNFLRNYMMLYLPFANKYGKSMEKYGMLLFIYPIFISLENIHTHLQLQYTAYSIQLRVTPGVQVSFAWAFLAGGGGMDVLKGPRET